MRIPGLLSLSMVALVINVPSAFAKIWPDDFVIPENTVSSSSSSSSSTSSVSSMPDSGTAEPSEPFYFASEIPAGRLTRAQFADALATRLYDADAHDNCFGELVLSSTYNYNLLFSDVSLDAQYASSICLLMRNGITQGLSDGSFRPDRAITVAEAAAMLANVGGLPLRDSNHMRPGEAWYQRFMDAIRAVDREFTMRPSDIMTGAQLEHTMCVLKKYTREMDPLNEFTEC